MNRKIKLIWDFFGDDSLQTAKHHAVHLKEFALKANITFAACSVETIQENHHIAFMTVDESNMITVRDALRPKRGQWIEEERI